MQNLKLYRAVNDLVRVVSNCELQMRNAAKTYRANRAQYAEQSAASAPQATLDKLNAEAKFILQHGVTRPGFIQSRINQLLKKYNAATFDGIMAGIPGGKSTHTDLINEINTLAAVQDAIIVGVNVDGWTADQVAAYLEANVPDNNDLYAQPAEATYIEPLLNLTL